MIIEFFVFLGYWWWLLFSVFLIAEIACLEKNNGGGATFAVLLFGGTMLALGDWNPFPVMIADPLWAIEMVGAYFLCGAVWSVIKWYFHGLNIRDEYRTVKSRFFNTEGIVGDKIPQKLVSKWENTIERNFPNGVPPKAMDNKASILMWMSHWPFSFIWTLINDPIRRIFMFIYARIANLMQKISNATFKNELVEYDDD